MTTENVPATPENESVTPETPASGNETPAVVYSETEQLAMESGWIPEDKYEGDKKEFRSAREFLERGEMIGKIRALSKQTNQLNDAIKHISTQNQKLYDNGYKQAVTDLKVEKRAALADGDLVKADELQEKIDEVKEKQAEFARSQPAKATGPDPDHEAWVAAGNQWYDSNPVLRNFADALAIEYVRVNQGQVSPTDVRSYVAKTVKEEFAHRFNAKQVVGAPQPDGQGRNTNRTGNNTNGTNQYQSLKDSMSESDRQIMKTICKSTGMTEQDYFKQYNA